MLTALAANTAIVVNEINACTIIMSFAHRERTGVSVGELMQYCCERKKQVINKTGTPSVFSPSAAWILCPASFEGTEKLRRCVRLGVLWSSGTSSIESPIPGGENQHIRGPECCCRLQHVSRLFDVGWNRGNEEPE